MNPSKSEPIAVWRCEPVISAIRSRCEQITSNESSNVFAFVRRRPSLSWCWAKISPMTPSRPAISSTVCSSSAYSWPPKRKPACEASTGTRRSGSSRSRSSNVSATASVLMCERSISTPSRTIAVAAALPSSVSPTFGCGKTTR